MARREGIPGEKTPNGILTRFDKLSVGRLLAQIEVAATPQLTGLGLLLLQLGSKTATLLSAGIDRLVREAKRDGRNPDLSVPVDDGGCGITIHCNGLPEGVAHQRLSRHCKVRKYDCKANAWYGLLLDPESGQIRGVLVNEENWRPDRRMDELVRGWVKKPPVSIGQLASGSRKVGRNDPCPCGSGNKYKKCCLIA